MRSDESQPQDAGKRHFLLLQMPCGSFGRELQKALRQAGHQVTRVAVCGGDLMSAFPQRVVSYRRSLADWPAWVADFARRHAVTDLVCYNDARAYHRLAIQALKPQGIAIHVLEEGYLRPNWVTCEADGVNGHSALTRIDLDRIPEQPEPEPEIKLQPANVRYSFSGFKYYMWAFFFTPMFPRFENHRQLEILGEGVIWLQRLGSWPARLRRTRQAMAEIARTGKPVHLVLLQLNGDSQVKVHSSFRSTRHFVEHCIAEFKASGTQDAVLVFKNHPLDNGVIDLRQVIAEETEHHGLTGRVFFVETGKLVPLLELSISATAINSTACHQPLLRGIPTLVLGRAVFNHPQIVSRMRLADFFRLRPLKSREHYDKLVSVMRQTCQFNGGYHSEEGRRILLPALVDALENGTRDPRSFETLTGAAAPVKQVS